MKKIILLFTFMFTVPTGCGALQSGIKPDDSPFASGAYLSPLLCMNIRERSELKRCNKGIKKS